MNWRRGLFRAWLLLSALWTAGYAYSCILEGTSVAARSIETPFWDTLLIGASPPWLLTAAVLGLRWTIRGFRGIGDYQDGQS